MSVKSMYSPPVPCLVADLDNSVMRGSTLFNARLRACASPRSMICWTSVCCIWYRIRMVTTPMTMQMRKVRTNMNLTLREKRCRLSTGLTAEGVGLGGVGLLKNFSKWLSGITTF